MLKLDMDTARAAAWKNKVDTEIEAVLECLAKVAKLTQECEIAINEAGEDTIMNVINETGVQLTEKWTTLSNKFQEVQSLCTQLIKATQESGERSKAIIEDFKNRNK